MSEMRLEPVERLNLTLSAGAIATSFAIATPHFATSLAIGAALEAFNYGALHRSAKALFGGVIIGGGPWVAVFALRFVFLAAGIILSLHAGANAAGLVVGLSIAMPATLITAWINRPQVNDPETLPALDADDPAWDRWSVWRVREIDADETDGEMTAEMTAEMNSEPMDVVVLEQVVDRVVDQEEERA